MSITTPTDTTLHVESSIQSPPIHATNATVVVAAVAAPSVNDQEGGRGSHPVTNAAIDPRTINETGEDTPPLQPSHPTPGTDDAAITQNGAGLLLVVPPPADDLVANAGANFAVTPPFPPGIHGGATSSTAIQQQQIVVADGGSSSLRVREAGSVTVAATANGRQAFTDDHSRTTEPVLISSLSYREWRQGISPKGLPDDVKAYLSRWMSEHSSHPYPTRDEKDLMMRHLNIKEGKKLEGWFQRARKRRSKTKNEPLPNNVHCPDNMNTDAPSAASAKEEELVEGADLLRNLFYSASSDADDSGGVVGEGSARRGGLMIGAVNLRHSPPSVDMNGKKETWAGEGEDKEGIFEDSDDDGVAEFMHGVSERKEDDVVEGDEAVANDHRGCKGVDDIPREMRDGVGPVVSPPKRIDNSHRLGGVVAVPRLPPKFVFPDPPRPSIPTHALYQRPKSPTATEYYVSISQRNDNDNAATPPHLRERTDAEKELLCQDDLYSKPSSTITALAALEDFKRSSSATIAPTVVGAVANSMITEYQADQRPQNRNDKISSAADSVAAAAMMLMTGSRTRSRTIETMDVVAEPNAMDHDGSSNGVEEQNQRIVSPSTIETKVSKLPEGCLLRFDPDGKSTTPPKQQVKLNLGGTVVQVPTEILLKHEGSRIAAIARSAMRVGDSAISLPRDYELFCHCVFYVCNDKVQLPPNIRRKEFMKEMKYYGIPLDETHVSGGQITSPTITKLDPLTGRPLPQISPTTVTKLHYQQLAALAHAAPADRPHHPDRLASESKVGVSEVKGRASPLDLLTSALSTLKSPVKDEGSPIDQTFWQIASMGEAVGEPKAVTTYQSPLDLLSSAISSTTDGSWQSTASSHANRQVSNSKVRQTMCKKCDVCLREDCGECIFCLDKPKFGGPNRLRKKCLLRRCPSVTTKPPSPDTTERSSAKQSDDAKDGKLTTVCRSTVEAAEKRWAENLEFLRPCIKDGGLINYNIIPDEEVRNRVRIYVKDCRKQHRRIENNGPTSLTQERLRLLEEANFPWSHNPYANKKPEKNLTSSLDVLLSVTSQSYKEARLCKDYNDKEVHAEEFVDKDESEESVYAEEAVDLRRRMRRYIPSFVGSLKSTITRGVNCGTCANCQRNDCGSCKSCLDKTKFGGPSKLRRRCELRRCRHMIRERSDDKPSVNEEVDTVSLDQCCTVGRSRPSKPGGRSEEERMIVELANIRAELDAKARGIKYGLRGLTIKSTTTTDNLAREIEAKGSEDDSIDSVESGEDDNAARELRAGVAPPTDMERGVTVRPSGKWQVQLYYAGNSRYIGLFDSRKEACVAYAIARECMSSFKESSPNPEQIKRNLDLMRKAAFSGGTHKARHVEESNHSERKKVAKEEKSKRADASTKAIKGKSKRTHTVRALAELKRSQDIQAKVEAESKAKSKSPKLDIKSVHFHPNRKQAPKPSPRAHKTKKNAQVDTIDVVADNVLDERGKRKFTSEFSPDVYERAKSLAEGLPRGITVRPSGKWQVQLYYAGKSRYIGVFETKIDAAVAYELARDCFAQFKDGDDPSPEQTKNNVIAMREAAFAPFPLTGRSDVLERRIPSKKAKCETEGKSCKDQKTFPPPTIMQTSNAVLMASAISAEPTSNLSPTQYLHDCQPKDETSELPPNLEPEKAEQPPTLSVAHVVNDAAAMLRGAVDKVTIVADVVASADIDTVSDTVAVAPKRG